MLLSASLQFTQFCKLFSLERLLTQRDVLLDDVTVLDAYVTSSEDAFENFSAALFLGVRKFAPRVAIASAIAFLTTSLISHLLRQPRFHDPAFHLCQPPSGGEPHRLCHLPTWGALAAFALELGTVLAKLIAHYHEHLENCFQVCGALAVLALLLCRWIESADRNTAFAVLARRVIVFNFSLMLCLYLLVNLSLPASISPSELLDCRESTMGAIAALSVPLCAALTEWHATLPYHTAAVTTIAAAAVLPAAFLASHPVGSLRRRILKWLIASALLAALCIEGYVHVAMDLVEREAVSRSAKDSVMAAALRVHLWDKVVSPIWNVLMDHRSSLASPVPLLAGAALLAFSTLLVRLASGRYNCGVAQRALRDAAQRVAVGVGIAALGALAGFEMVRHLTHLSRRPSQILLQLGVSGAAVAAAAAVFCWRQWSSSRPGAVRRR
eukprot:gene15013-17744_t